MILDYYSKNSNSFIIRGEAKNHESKRRDIKMKKRALIFTFCLLLGLTLLSIPVFASDEVIASTCSEWDTYNTYYECRGNDTWIVYQEMRVCMDSDGRVTIETRERAEPYLKGVCPYIAKNTNM
jgi:hypothetical protein